MIEAQPQVAPDHVIEDEAVDFFLDEALPPEDQIYLMDIVEQDEKLSQILDTLIIKAIEVTDAGVVEGEGTGTSDSIPARLSDGEFVFTAKAVEAIGVENLEKMMREAEGSVSVPPSQEESTPSLLADNVGIPG